MRRLYAPPPPNPPKPPDVDVDCPNKLDPMFPIGLPKFTWFNTFWKLTENVRL